LGNSRIKSFSLAQLRRKPMELRSEPDTSGVVVALALLSGLEVAISCQHGHISPIFLNVPVGSPAERVFTHVRPNSWHFRHGTLLSHLTFNREHSSHACRFRPRSKEFGMAEFPRLSQRLKWSRSTSLEV
jgi:hypothetical protein